MVTDPLPVAMALVAAQLGGIEVDVPRCRRCRAPAGALRMIGDPPGPWCDACRPHRRLDTSKPWARPRCRHGCPVLAAYYLTPAGGRIGPVCPEHAPPPCHWPPDPTPERTP